MTGAAWNHWGLTRGCRTMSVRGPQPRRGPKAQDGCMCKDLWSEGKFMGVNEIGSCRVDIKSKATLQNCGSYIGTGDG